MATKVTPTNATLAAAALIGIGGFVVEKLPDGSMNIQNPITAKVYEKIIEQDKHPYPHIRTTIDSLPPGKEYHLISVVGGVMVAHDMFIIPEPDSGHRMAAVQKASFQQVRNNIVAESDSTGE